MIEKVTGPIKSRTFHLPEVCNVNEGHQHNYDHAMIVIRGRLQITYRYEKDGQIVEGESIEYGQGDEIAVLAKVFHTVKALEPDTVYKCIFSHRDFDGLVTQTFNAHSSNPRAYV